MSFLPVVSEANHGQECLKCFSWDLWRQRREALDVPSSCGHLPGVRNHGFRSYSRQASEAVFPGTQLQQWGQNFIKIITKIGCSCPVSVMDICVSIY